MCHGLPEGHGKPHSHHHVCDPPVFWTKDCQKVAPHLENLIKKRFLKTALNRNLKH